MLGIVGASVAKAPPHVEYLERLPDPPALRWSGFLVSVDDSREFCSWLRRVREGRAFLPVGVILDASQALDLLRAALRVSPILHREDTVDGDTVGAAVCSLLEHTIEMEIVTGWVAKWPCAGTAELRALAAVGVQGRSRRAAAALLGVGIDVLERRLAAAGLPSARSLALAARLAAVDLRRRRGMGRSGAAAASSWTVKAWEKAAARARHDSF